MLCIRIQCENVVITNTITLSVHLICLQHVYRDAARRARSSATSDYGLFSPQHRLMRVANTPFTRYSRLSNRFDNRLYRVNKHPTGCQTGCQSGSRQSPADKRFFTIFIVQIYACMPAFFQGGGHSGFVYSNGNLTLCPECY